MPVILINVDKASVKRRKVVGRGCGNGRGRYCGKGQKGQKARKGAAINPRFEGGQMPLYRRIPKRGFKNINKVVSNIINMSNLSIFDEGSDVTIEVLKEKGLIKANNAPVKLLGTGELKVKKLKIKVNATSEAAKQKIEKLGGTVEII